MKDYLRLIGITSDNAPGEQVRQAHFRTYRHYQGRKNSSSAVERAEADLVIDYLRKAQFNPDLPLPSSLKHLIPTAASAPPVEKVEKVEKSLPPTDNVAGKRAEKVSEQIAVDTPPVPTTRKLDDPPTMKMPSHTGLPDIDNIVEDDLVLEPMFDSGDLPPTKPTQPLKPPAAVSEPPPLPAKNQRETVELTAGKPITKPPTHTISVSGRQVVLGDVIHCPDCEWDIITQSDSYCSGCGKSITSVEAPAELIIYISESGSYAKSFTITNNGLIPVVVGAFEVIDIAAAVHPATSVVLGKNEGLAVQLRVTEERAFGKRSGRLRFRYHDKPVEIPVRLKEPPLIWLDFPDVPVVAPLHEGFLLRMPVSQRTVACRVNTDSDTLLVINAVNFDESRRATSMMEVRRDQPFLITIDDVRTREFALTLTFQELGSRKFIIRLETVDVPNLIDHVEQYCIGEHAIILGSGTRVTRLSLRNEPDRVTGEGRGLARKIKLKGAPPWLTLEPAAIDALASGETVVVKLTVDPAAINRACREHVELEIDYFDPQLNCDRKRPLPVQLPFEFIEPRRFDDWIAIDFGTSNSCAAIFEGTTVRSLIVDSGTQDTNLQESPSCIQFVDEAQRQYLCGNAAYSQRFSGPRAIKSTAWAFKPQLSRVSALPQTYLDITHGRAHTKTADELVQIYARALLQQIRLRNGIAPHKAVVTFPVTFGKSQRERLAAAFQAAGLDAVVTPVSEPVALAIHYAYLHREIFLSAAVVAVFDFGGGSTDLAIFQIRPAADKGSQPEFHLLDVGGVDVGGELLTFELAAFIYRLLVPEPEQRDFLFPASLDSLLSGHSDIARENFRRLADLAERVKRSFRRDALLFTEDLTVDLESARGNRTFKCRLSANDVEMVLGQRIEQAITTLADMITGLHRRGVIAEPKLDRLLLAGNSSRLPLVTELIAATLFDGDFTRVLVDRENMKLGVTKGALLYAAASEALPFPVEHVNQTLPCRVGLLAANFRFDMLFERGIHADQSAVAVRRHLKLARGQEYLRLYYYFGHDVEPKVLDNPKMREHTVPCPTLSGRDIEATFQLLPDCAGIEIRLSAGGEELTYTAPILI